MSDEPDLRLVPTALEGRYVASWANAGAIRARVLAGDAAGEERWLFPAPGAGASFRYARHASTYKPAFGRLMAVAQAELRPLPRIPDYVEYSLELAVFDAELRPLARRFMNLPGLQPTAWQTELALAADDWHDDCCALLAYVDKRSPGGGLRLQRLDSLGARLGEEMVLPNTASTGSLSHPHLTYQRLRDHFLLVYETRADIRVRTVPAVSGSPGTELVVASKLRTVTREDLVDGKPSVAWSPSLRRYLVTWLDYAGAGSTQRVVRAAFLDEFGRAPGAAFTVRRSCSAGDWSCLLQPEALGQPAALAAGQTFQVLFPARPALRPAEDSQIVGYRVWFQGATTPPQMTGGVLTALDEAHRSRVVAARRSPEQPGFMLYRESFISPLHAFHSVVGEPVAP